jgi:formylglycine-generating enzyme required for sulfatase activity
MILALTLALACPVEMARIAGMDACIDRFEASLDGDRAVSKKGVLPADAVSWKEAVAACEKAGKHLCSRAEWTAACKGADGRRKYAYGSRYEPKRCNDRARSGKANQPAPTGSLSRCRTPEGSGVYDLSGNVWEWLAELGHGAQSASLVGGGWTSDDNDENLSCAPEDPVAQPLDQKVSGRGFRCCAELSSSR